MSTATAPVTSAPLTSTVKITITVSDNLYTREGDIIEVVASATGVIAALRKALRTWEPETEPAKAFSSKRTRGTPLSASLRKQAVEFAESAIHRSWGHERMTVGTLRHLEVDVVTGA